MSAAGIPPRSFPTPSPLLLLEDSSAAYAAYNSGEAQLVKDVPTDEIPSLTKAEDGGDFYVDTILGTYYISLNDQKEPFTDPNVRKALSLAIDRDYVANTIMQGHLHSRLQPGRPRHRR